MKKNIFFAACCSVLVFMSSCYQEVKTPQKSMEAVNYAIDPLEVKIAEVETEDIITIRGEENIVETDSSVIRYCPVRFVNTKTTEVKDVVFVIEENY